MADGDVQLEDFLQKVDEIDGLVKNLAAAQGKDANKTAINNADRFLDVFGKAEDQKKQAVEKKKKYPPRDNTGVNRSVINQAAFEDDVRSGPQLNNEMSQEAFMSVIEQDAKRRAAKKDKQRKEATVIKEKGNREFQNGNYESAVKLYTEALDIMKDYSALWTNRAQCYIKLDQFELAIEDCDWALRISEKCLKAYIHKGKALAALHRFEESLMCFETAIEVEPSKEKVIAGYVADIQLQKKSFEDEQKAQEAFNAGDMESKGIVGIMEKLKSSGQLPYYYSGGLRLIRQAMKDTNEKTIFRTSGGLQLTETHPYISKCFSASPRSLSQDEVDMCAATMETYETACSDNEENQRIILEIPSLPDQILRLLESKWKSTKLVKLAIIQMLHVMSQTELIRTKLVATYNITRLLSSLFELMRAKNQTTATAAVGLLNNLALDKKFKAQLRDKINDVLPAFEALMLDHSSMSAALPSCVSTVTNLCGDVTIRKQLLQRQQTWEACSSAMEHYSKNSSHHESCLYSLLGLVLNLTLENSENLKVFSPRLCVACCRLISQDESLSKVKDRACGVLGHVLPHSEESVNHVCDQGTLPKLLEIMKSDDLAHIKPALKALTACTQHNTLAREQVCHSQGLDLLASLLKHSDEHIIGNSALSLSHCAEIPIAAETLTRTNVVMNALVLARDANNMTVRQNCAILIAKLAQGHVKHLERLRELDGLGILHGIMKHIKS